jgi:hypothetical protein
LKTGGPLESSGVSNVAPEATQGVVFRSGGLIPTSDARTGC